MGQKELLQPQPACQDCFPSKVDANGGRSVSERAGAVDTWSNLIPGLWRLQPSCPMRWFTGPRGAGRGKEAWQPAGKRSRRPQAV